MEYIESKKITSVKHNNEKIAIELMTCFVKNVLQSGYIHCDPHPGNIGINDTGQIVLYDFGMVTDLTVISKNISEKYSLH